MKKSNSGFTLVELLVVIGILGILMGALFPAITSAMLAANTSACSMRGRSLFMGITQANTERESAGLGNVWPRSAKEEGADSEDIASMSFSTSTKYFEELFDMDKFGKENWQPYLSGVDIGVLSGSGVPGMTGTTLEPKNVTWIIAANVQDEMEDVVPVLVTRNVAYQDLKTDNYDGTTTTEIKCGKSNGGESDTPFSNKAWVLVRKGGAAQVIKAKYSRMNVVYNRQSFKIPESDNTFQYLPTGL